MGPASCSHLGCRTGCPPQSSSKSADLALSPEAGPELSLQVSSSSQPPIWREGGIGGGIMVAVEVFECASILDS
jgi:hypothetical protein